ncbi:MAG: 16S rRNA (guanine(966)-N(2))-methyltransferase RsmD [Pyrinomonadaceae bacterium]
MNNRRYGTAHTSKPYRKRSFSEQGGERYGQKSYRSRYSSDSPSKNENRNSPRDYKRGGRDQYKSRFNPKRRDDRFRPEARLPRIVSDMQITDGKHRGKYLKSSDSPRVRPTARRIREVMFRILFKRVRAGRFLDLCAGSGTVGLEAISRGALISTFVERSARLCSYIRKNMENLEIKEGHGEIFEMEVIPFLKRMMNRRRYWDVVYFDPPYNSNYDEVLSYFARGATVKIGGVLVIEHQSEMIFPEKFGVMRRWKVVVNGESALSFYDRRF